MQLLRTLGAILMACLFACGILGRFFRATNRASRSMERANEYRMFDHQPPKLFRDQ